MAKTKPKPNHEPPPEPKRGRPSVADEAKRATLVRVLTTEAEHDELRRAAESASMSVSTFVRAAALEKARGNTK